MRLKHLHLQGYKTFANKTEFLFPTGITAIVGPNGSGKSNIADAIRWVLGEQSYGSLRAKRTEDMIFSGSESRPRAGMAEANITLDNSDGWLPIEFSEVTIGRRAYRDGQNEYLLNGNKVLLRDIKQLLSQSGLSRRTYTVIGQGLVDAALSLRAEERRELFEEAAGISHYQAKRANALGKLEETEHNLERVHDILGEIKPRLNRLQRQAERTREHLEISQHLEKQLHTWYGYRWGQALSALDAAQQHVEGRRQEHKERCQTLHQLSERIHQLRQQQSRLRGQLSEWHRESSQLHRQAEKGQRELAVLTERRRLLQAQIEETRTDIAPLQARHAAQAERVAQAQKELEAADQAFQEHKAAVQAAQTGLTARQARRDDLLTQQNQAQKQLTRLQSDLVKRQSRQENLIERQRQLQAEIGQHRQKIEGLSQQLTAQNAALSQAQAGLEALKVEIDQASQAQARLRAQREQLSQQLAEQKEAQRRARQAEAEASARLDLLDQLRRDFAIYGEATRSILNANLPGVRGVLAQLIDVPADLTAAVEAALGADASAIVVEDWTAARSALQHLRASGVSGRVTLLPLPETDQSHHQGPKGADRLAERIGCKAPLRPLLDRLLKHVYLIPDLEPPLPDSQLAPPHSGYVTPNGDLLRADGALATGRPAESTSPLAQEQEWNRLQEQRTSLGARHEEIERQVEETQRQLERLDQQSTRQAIALDDLGAQLKVQQEKHQALARQADRLEQEIDWQTQQRDQAQTEIAQLAQHQADLETGIKGLGQAQIGLKQKIDQLSAALQELPIEGLGQELSQAQTAVAVARQTRQSQEKILSGLQATLDQIAEQERTRQERVVSLSREKEQVAPQIEQLQKGQADLKQKLNALTDQIEPAETRLAQREKEQDQAERQERSLQQRLHEFESHLTSAELNLARRQDELENLRGRIEKDLGLVELEMGPGVQGQSPLPLRPLVSQLPTVEQLPPGLEEEISRLRAQLRRLGAVNPTAPAEYDELLERHTFLNEQIADLKQAGETLQKVIAELDDLIEKAFRETFEAIAAQFKQTFTNLFGGGSARLELTEPQDLTHTGIDIIARPPGKRQQNLALLSGGERALTAAALIFAILQVSPTPFCILDEVDAMLDEANVGRFRQTLENMAEQTQFIIITHNRGTITAADTLYGISMGADSVSQAVSLRMDGEQIDLA